MIQPNMATMLCFITTDIAIAPELLQTALSDVIRDTFNMVSVDGDTSYERHGDSARVRQGRRQR